MVSIEPQEELPGRQQIFFHLKNGHHHEMSRNLFREFSHRLTLHQYVGHVKCLKTSKAREQFKFYEYRGFHREVLAKTGKVNFVYVKTLKR
jgi:hypothetical protein